MKISILLPYKENFSPNYPGAVSLFVDATTRNSKYKKNITIFGNTKFKQKFNLKYVNINLKKNVFQSQSKVYVKKFIEEEIEKPSNLIEIHNRPNYLKFLVNNLDKKNYTIYFHNDPLSMKGSKTISERKFLLKHCYRIIFNSNWSRTRFLEGMESKYINSEKLIVICQSAKKAKSILAKRKLDNICRKT